MNSKSTTGMLAAAILSALTGVGCSNPSSAQAATAAPGIPAVGNAAPTKAEVTTAIRSLLAKHHPGERVGSVSHIRTAKDSTGRWWAWGQEDSRPGTDGSAMIMCRGSDGWKAISYGSSPDAELVPAEIRKELCPDYARHANPAVSNAAPTKAEVATAIRACLAELDPGQGVGSISHIRTAKDSAGRWWAWGQEDARPGTDGSAMIMCRGSDGWKAISYGSSPDAELVPAEIRKELCAQ